MFRVKSMLDRFDRWNVYLTDAGKDYDGDLIGLYARTGSSLGCADSVHKLEVIAGKKIGPKKPDSKPVVRK